MTGGPVRRGDLKEQQVGLKSIPEDETSELESRWITVIHVLSWAEDDVENDTLTEQLEHSLRHWLYHT